jgi:hypothetical protein
MEEKPKPEKLYRGVVITPELLQATDYGAVLVPPNEPIYDEEGRKCVGDGNEYGVYMTDYLEMARSAYGNPDGHTKGFVGDKGYFSMRMGVLNGIPQIGIIYEIDTQDLDYRKPWINPKLRGHYNNGFVGDEYIADEIPAKNYRVIEAVIGSDFLHKEKRLTVEDIDKTKEEVAKIIEERKMHLEKMYPALKKLSYTELQGLSAYVDKGLVLKDLFGEDGAAYIDLDSFKIESEQDKVKYLLAGFYHKNEETLDYSSLLYVESIKQKLNDKNNTKTVEEIISEDIENNKQKRENFIKRKKEENKEYTTNSFDSKEERMLGMLESLKSKTQEKVEEKPVVEEKPAKESPAEQIAKQATIYDVSQAKDIFSSVLHPENAENKDDQGKEDEK